MGPLGKLWSEIGRSYPDGAEIHKQKSVFNISFSRRCGFSSSPPSQYASREYALVILFAPPSKRIDPWALTARIEPWALTADPRVEGTSLAAKIALHPPDRSHSVFSGRIRFFSGGRGSTREEAVACCDAAHLTTLKHNCRGRMIASQLSRSIQQCTYLHRTQGRELRARGCVQAPEAVRIGRELRSCFKLSAAFSSPFKLRCAANWRFAELGKTASLLSITIHAS